MEVYDLMDLLWSVVKILQPPKLVPPYFDIGNSGNSG